MLCYKAKNYALLQNGEITLRGSAFRNRATEPFLRKLTETMVKDKLLGRDDEALLELKRAKESILKGEAAVEDLSKGEYISKSPAQYREDVERTGKGRRAALEAALLMRPMPEVGDKVFYYMTRGDSPREADWKRARPTAMYDAARRALRRRLLCRQNRRLARTLCRLVRRSRPTQTGRIVLRGFLKIGFQKVSKRQFLEIPFNKFRRLTKIFVSPFRGSL